MACRLKCAWTSARVLAADEVVADREAEVVGGHEVVVIPVDRVDPSHSELEAVAILEGPSRDGRAVGREVQNAVHPRESNPSGQRPKLGRSGLCDGKGKDHTGCENAPRRNRGASLLNQRQRTRLVGFIE